MLVQSGDTSVSFTAVDGKGPIMIGAAEDAASIIVRRLGEGAPSGCPLDAIRFDGLNTGGSVPRPTEGQRRKAPRISRAAMDQLCRGTRRCQHSTAQRLHLQDIFLLGPPVHEENRANTGPRSPAAKLTEP